MKFDSPDQLGPGQNVVGKRMNWAVKVSALRKRLRLKQRAFADLIGTSQTYVSRLEAGIITPSPTIAGAIEALVANPRTRSVFDAFVSTVRHSPHCSILVDVSGADAIIRAASRRVNEHFPDGARLSQSEHLETIKADIGALIDAGLTQGLVASGEALWLDKRNKDRHWRLIYVPIRDEANSWYVDVMLIEIGAEAFQARRQETGPDIQIKRTVPE